MNEAQARDIFKLKDSDPIYKDGLLSLQQSILKQLSVWSITPTDKKELEAQLEAIDCLMEVAI